MSTDDCFEIGKGKCPCGKGWITVEKCSPDHAWAKSFWYSPALACDDCKKEYGFYDSAHGSKPRLVLRADLVKKDSATAAWHAKIKEIEALPSFVALRAKVDAILASQKSAAARYRILSAAGLASGSLASYRKNNTFYFSGVNAGRAMKPLEFHDDKMQTKVAELKVLRDQADIMPKGLITGINGLEQ
jgi:hypothetical protein